MKLLTISGSLRSGSSNTKILRAISKLVPEELGITIARYERLADLPHFNPELESEKEIESVKFLRTAIKEADAVIICTPEYAFGIPGTLKNALDWVVSSGEMNEKPVAAISASPSYTGADKALASLALTLTALGTKTPEECKINIAMVNKKLDEKGELSDVETEQKLKGLLTKLIEEVNKLKVKS